MDRQGFGGPVSSNLADKIVGRYVVKGHGFLVYETTAGEHYYQDSTGRKHNVAQRTNQHVGASVVHQQQAQQGQPSRGRG